MQKMSAHIEMAAAEYRQEIGKEELAPFWSAEYFQDCGVMDDYPGLSLIEFHALVQKALTQAVEREEKRARLELDKHKRATKK